MTANKIRLLVVAVHPASTVSNLILRQYPVKVGRDIG
jgi:hypothetical protein